MKIAILILSLYISTQCFGQEYKIYEENRIWITISNSSQAISLEKDKYNILDDRINKIMQKNNITSIQKAFPNIKGSEILRDALEINCECNLENLIADITAEFEPSEILRLERIPIYYPLHTPNDYAYGESNFTSHLELINARFAWDISKGNENIKIAIMESHGFDLLHEDLVSEIAFEDGNVNYSSYHGTPVAGAAAAATNNEKGYGSIGYKCKLMLYKSTSIQKMYEAAQNGAKVINCSFGSPAFSQFTQDIIDNINDLGTSIVAGAGNGICWERKFCQCQPELSCDDSCICGPCDLNSFGDQQESLGSGLCLIYPASYNHVISVTSVGHLFEVGYTHPDYGQINWQDIIENHIGDPKTSHNKNSKVNICAPGFHIIGPKIGNTYEPQWGTSFASPIVAGCIGLLYSVNPCLTPEEVESIIYETANEIGNLPVNSQYQGLIGEGRLNAFNAVKEAATTCIENETITSNEEHSSYIICTDNISVTNGSNLSLVGNKAYYLHGSFQIENGSSFSVNLNENNLINCN